MICKLRINHSRPRATFGTRRKCLIQNGLFKLTGRICSVRMSIVTRSRAEETARGAELSARAETSRVTYKAHLRYSPAPGQAVARHGQLDPQLLLDMNRANVHL